jgi:hypothetical protein
MEAGSILENLSCSLWSSSHHEVDLNGPSKIVCLIRCKVVCRQRFFRSVVAEVYASDACSMICTVRGLAPGGFFTIMMVVEAECAVVGLRMAIR